MCRWPKTQFRSALKAFSADSINSKWSRLASDEQRLATAKIVTTALVVIFGFGAGWMAGKALSGALLHSSPDIDYSSPIEPQTRPDDPDFQSPPPGQEEQRMGIVVKRHRGKSAEDFGQRVLKQLLKEFKHHDHHGRHKD